MENYYIDKRGYPRDNYSHELIHRRVAYNKIYLPNRNQYSLPFSSYVVHHINENKFDCRVNNLQILTREEHEKVHGKKRVSFNMIRNIILIVIIVFLLSLFLKHIGFEQLSVGLMLVTLWALIIFSYIYKIFRKWF